MDQLGMLAKYWQPGRVKTRLAHDLGPESAAQLHRQFVHTLLERLAQLADRRVLVYTPAEREDAFRQAAGSNWRLTAQPAGDLGCRLRVFFEQSFADGARRVVCIGSDSPDLPTEFIQHAWDLLRHVPVVLGPAGDGGYYLIGAAHQTPDIFQHVDWGTASVWQQTVAQLTEQNIPFERLPTWHDVDQLDDLRLLRDRLATASTTHPALSSLRASVEAALRRGGGERQRGSGTP